MRCAVKMVSISLLAFALGGPAVAAELRDISGNATALENLQTSTASGRPASGAALGAQAARALDLDENSSLLLRMERPLPLNLGRTLRFQQTVNGIPIWGTNVIVQQDGDGRTIGIDGQAVFDISPSVGAAQPALSPESALDIAKAITQDASTQLDTAEYENEETELVFYLGPTGDLALAYRTSFFTTVEDDGGGAKPTRPIYLISASTGESLDYLENIQFAQDGTGPGGNQKTGRYDYGSGRLPKFEVTEQGSRCRMDSTNVMTEDLNHGTSGPGTPYEYDCYENTRKQINGAFSPLNDAQTFGKV